MYYVVYTLMEQSSRRLSRHFFAGNVTHIVNDSLHLLLQLFTPGHARLLDRILR